MNTLEISKNTYKDPFIELININKFLTDKSLLARPNDYAWAVDIEVVMYILNNYEELKKLKDATRH